MITVLTIILTSIVCFGVHIWRCTILVESFERRFDEAQDYWRKREIKTQSEALEYWGNQYLALRNSAESGVQK
jgi:hypothetical protein